MKNTTTSYFKRIRNTLLYCLAFLLPFFSQVHAQGWQQSFGSDNPEEAYALLEDVDGGFLLVGTGIAPDGDLDQDIFLIKLDIDGTLVWTKYFDNGGQQLPRAIARLADDNLIIVGSITDQANNRDVQLLKVDARGNQIWSRNYGGDISESANDVATLADGGFVIVGENDAGTDIESDILVVRFDALGNARWQKTFGTDRSDVGNAITVLGDGLAIVGDSKNEAGFDNDIVVYDLDASGDIIWERRLSNNFLEEGRAITATQDGGIVIAGQINDQPDAFAAKFDAAGNLRWSRTIGSNDFEEIANAITELPDGSLVLAGIAVEMVGINADFYLAKLGSGGDIIWERKLGRTDYLDEANAVVNTLDGGFALAGYNAPGLSFENDIVLVKTDALGNTFTNEIRGRVYFDADQQCDADPDEENLTNWVVVASNGTETFYGTTDDSGIYAIGVDTGRFSVDFIPTNRYWQKCKLEGYNVSIEQFYDTVTVDMGATANVECPYLEVDISTAYFPPCDNIVYTVEYCNLGTSSATDAFVEVLLDQQLTYVSSALEANQTEQMLTFQLGDVARGECGSFTFTASSPCTGLARNQAVLVDAEIFPAINCLEVGPDWDRSDLEVSVECIAQEAIFSIKNVGIAKMAAPQKTVVIEQDVILSIDNILLEPAQDTSIKVSFSEGRNPNSTYRMIVDQSPDHPFKTIATIAIEGCANDNIDLQTGFYTQFPEDDDAPNRSKDVQEVIDSVPAVELSGYPKGYRQGIIAQETDLTYKFIMSNLGSDTVDRIVIRDTLSEFLDIATLQMGASSHPYTYEVYNDRVLKITFDDIELLPVDTGNNAEVVFVEFKIKQVAGNAPGTVIDNRAMIFFDAQAPLSTNLVSRTVEEYPDFVEVLVTNTNQIFYPDIQLKVYPNPFTERVQFDIIGTQNIGKLKFSVFDATGRLVDQQQYTGNRFEYLRKASLQTGLYYFQLETTNGQRLANGKLLVR